MKFNDVFEVAESENKITGIKNEKGLKDFSKFISKDEDGTYKFSSKEHKDFKFDTSLNKIVDKNVKLNGSDTIESDNDNSKVSAKSFENLTDKFKMLGSSIMYAGVVEIKDENVKIENIGKDVDPKELNSRYQILFKDTVVTEDMYKDTDPISLMEECARRFAYYTAKESNKLNKDTEYVVMNGEEIDEFTENIESDSVTKPFFLKMQKEYQNAYDEGVKEMGENSKAGRDLKDPITGEKSDAKSPGLLKRLGKKFAEGAKDIALDLLGINDGKDIISRMIRGALAEFSSGSSINKLLNKGRAEQFKKNKKLKKSDVEKHIKDLIKKVDEIAKQSDEPTAEEDEEEKV